MGTVTAIRQDSDVENKALEGLRELIAREVGRQIAPLEEMLRSESKSTETDERIDRQEAARRLGKSVKTVDDWIYKSKRNGFPVRRFPTGTVYFKWSVLLAWMKER